MRALAAAALVGVLHVHHAPSHDSDAPFAQVIEAAHSVGLDFLVLTEHSDRREDGPLPGGEHVGVHVSEAGHRVLVLAGAEFGTREGHLVGLAIPTAYASLDGDGEPLRAAGIIERIHRDGGFAVVPHPYSHGGWSGWQLPFDAIEVHNNASAYARQYGPLFPLRLLRFAVTPHAALVRMLARPSRELDAWDALLAEGRPVVGLSGADAHRNTSILGWDLDPYARMFSLVQSRCPPGPLEAAHVWTQVRSGRCAIRWRVHESEAERATEVVLPSGRVELQLGGGSRVLEVRNPPGGAPAAAGPTPGAGHNEGG